MVATFLGAVPPAGLSWGGIAAVHFSSGVGRAGHDDRIAPIIEHRRGHDPELPVCLFADG